MRNKFQIWGVLTFVLFLILSISISSGLFSTLDYQTTVFFQKVLPSFVVTPFSVFSILGTAEFATTILLLLLLFSKHLKKIYVLFFYVLTNAIELLGKIIISQISPPIEFLKTNIHLGFPSDSISGEFFSYPSGHLARTTFISGILLFAIYTNIKNRKSFSRFALPALALAVVGILTFDFFMFLSRVYLGEHWISDVIGGALLGFSLAILSLSIAKAPLRRLFL